MLGATTQRTPSNARRIAPSELMIAGARAQSHFFIRSIVVETRRRINDLRK
jgi:hypothetical protein